MLQLSRKQIVASPNEVSCTLWADEIIVIGLPSNCKVMQTAFEDVCFKEPGHMLAHFIISIIFLISMFLLIWEREKGRRRETETLM